MWMLAPAFSACSCRPAGFLAAKFTSVACGRAVASITVRHASESVTTLILALPHARLSGHGRRALQGQPGGEDPLDDLVLKAGGDPVPVLQHGHLPQLFLQPRAFLLGVRDPVAQAVGSHRD